MELDPDCLRDVLMCVEKHSTVNQLVDQKYFIADGLMDKYGYQKLVYHIRQADWGHLTVGTKLFAVGFIVQDVSPAGHEFLANIRADTNWKKTKDVAKKVGSLSVKTLTSIAGQVVASLIEETLHPGQ